MSEKQRDVRLYLTDLLDAIEKIERYVTDMSLEEFLEDDRSKDAVLRNLEVIGEAAKNLPLEIKDRYRDVDWKAAAGMRNKLIHEYFGVSFSIVWETIKNDLPNLKDEVAKILQDVEKQNLFD